MLWPNGTINKPIVSSPFGPRPSSIPGASTQHKGTDFIGFAVVKAVASGTVVAVGTPNGWSGGGYQVWIQHDGFLSRSMHMVRNSARVSVGQKVSEGQDLGVMGMTGTATGVHVHLEIVVNGIQVDPVPFIQARLTMPGTAGQEKEDEDMATFILERATNSQATKSLYDVKTGKAVRPISKDENTAFRKANSAAVVYVSVSDAEYRQRGGF